MKWREVNVVPVLKAGKDCSLSSGCHGTVYLTSCVCRMLEKMVSYGIVWIVES
jgi:hypothetical protein